MLDLKFVVENRDAVLAMLAKRGQSLADVLALPGLAGVDPWALDAERRALIQEVEALRHRQRVVGEEIARRGKAKEDASELKAEMKGVADRIKQGDARLEEVKAAIERFLWAYLEAEKRLAADKSAFAKAYAQYTGLPVEAARASAELISLGGVLDDDQVERQAATFHKLGVIQKDVSKEVRELYDDSIARRLRK